MYFEIPKNILETKGKNKAYQTRRFKHRLLSQNSNWKKKQKYYKTNNKPEWNANCRKRKCKK